MSELQGFFQSEKKKVKKKVNGKKISGCESCKQYMSCNSPKLGVVGNGDKKILIVAGMVSKRENTTGKLLSDLKGKYLRYALSKINIDIDRDCWYIPSIECYSSDKNAPSNIMRNSCKSRLHKVIKDLQPTQILTLGELPLEVLIGDRMVGRMSLKPTEKFYGSKIPDQELGRWVVPTYSIDFMLKPLKDRKEKLEQWGKWRKDKGNKPLWEHRQLYDNDEFILKQKFFLKHLKNLIDKVDFPKDTYESECSVITDVKEAITFLQLMQEEEVTSFDYEASGIKLHKKGHKIYCMSISNGIMSCGFPIFYDNKPFMRNLKRYLRSKNVGKISHNMAYEYQAGHVMFGYTTENFIWDSMLAAHVLDNRSNITGLKIQTYMRFGICGYDAKADQYIKASKEDVKLYGTNAFNNMDKMDIADMCMYCAKDSHFTYHLYDWQQKQIYGDKHLNKGYNLFHDGMLAFCKMMENGFVVDETQLIKNETLLDKKITKLKYKINNCVEIKEWYKVRSEEFNYSSPKQLSDFLFNVLNLPKTKKTSGNQYSTEAKELKDIKHLSEFVGNYLDLAKLIKITKDLEGIRRETVDGHIWPQWSLNVPQSYRSSSQNCNFQNHSQHDPFATEMVRSPLKAREGFRIVGTDASSLEVGVGCSVHRDSTMLKQLENGLDMHLGLSEKLFVGELGQVAKDMIEIKKEMGTFDPKNDTEKGMFKDLRYIGKNGMSFSLQFGDIYLSIGPTVWNKHLKDYHKQYFSEMGINTEAEFTEHIKSVCDWYWTENYGEFGQWRKDTWSKYVSTMRTKLMTGFYSTTVMSRNQSASYVIQGPAFHLILQAQTKIQEYIDKHKLKTRIIGQIHDAVYVDTPEDLSEWIGEGLRDAVVYYMTSYLMKKHRWIIHTMKADVDYYDNGNWYEHVEEEELLERYGYDVEKDKARVVIENIPKLAKST